MITATLSGEAMPPIELDFINTPVENAVDVVTLDGDIYTDFVSQHQTWEFNYDSLTEDEYNTLRAKYDSQWSDFQYPTLSIPYYSLTDKPVRMSINGKKIYDNCGSVEDVQIVFKETTQLNAPSVGYLVLEDGGHLILTSTSDLLL